MGDQSLPQAIERVRRDIDLVRSGNFNCQSVLTHLRWLELFFPGFGFRRRELAFAFCQAKDVLHNLVKGNLDRKKARPQLVGVLEKIVSLCEQQTSF